MNDAALQSVKDRIRKLFTLASDKGASEAEAETAMRLAMGLMAKHGIEQDALGVEKPKIKHRMRGEAAQAFEVTLAGAAGKLYGCTVVRHVMGGKTYPSFVGRDDNIDAAEMTMLWLISQVEAFYKQALPRGLTVSARAEFRRTFKQACASRVYRRADEFVKNPAALVETTGSTALVVAGYFDRLNEENNEFMAASMKVREGRVTKRKSGSGTLAGWDAGDRVQLHKRVGT